MSLIPYSPRDRDTQSVVLRHQQTLVLYDPKLQQLALRDLSPSSRAIESSSCPYCHRPLHEERSQGEGSNIGGPPSAESGFVDRDYFRMLDSSTRAPAPILSIPTQHTPLSPTRRRLPQNPQVEDIDEHDAASIATESTGESPNGISSGAFSPAYFERFFVTEGELGRGGNGVVLLVRHVLDGVSLGHFACKRVPVGHNHQWLEKVLTEVQLLQQLSHMNLVSYRHVWLESVRLTNFGPSVPCAFILQQYCNAGDLHKYILKPAASTTKEDLKDRMRRRSRGQPEVPTNINTFRRLPFDQILSYFRDIASGLSHLHSNGFIHRDLKPQNCLLNDTGIPGQHLRVLVSDFGEVQMENSTRNSTGATGTISYCAPEVLKRVEPGGAYVNFTTKSDVFSLGMTLYFMCFGNLPYEFSDEVNEENEDLDKLRAEISTWKGMVDREKLRNDLPERLYQSLERLLSPDPLKRPSADEIILGIGMGINDETIPVRSHSPSKNLPVDDALGFRRISPVADTPPPLSPRSKSPKRRGYSTFGEAAGSISQQSRQYQNRPSKPSKLRGLTQNSEEGTATSEPAASPNLDSSLILRPRLETQNLRLARSEISLMLPSIPYRARALAILRSSECINFCKLIVFLAKAISVTRPCSPLAANPYVFYPLLSLAATDFAFSKYQLNIALAVAHVIGLMFAGMLNALCLY